MVNRTIKSAIALALFLTICIGGCAMPKKKGGRDFNEGNVPKIVIGKATKSDVSNYLGSPLSTKRSVDGSETWTYNYQIITPYLSGIGVVPKEDRIEKAVFVNFGNNDVVKECMYVTISYKDSVKGTIFGGTGDRTQTRCQDVR